MSQESSSIHRSFGVEEEYLLLDGRTGEPVNRAAEIIRAAPEMRTDAEREFFSSQIETATPVCTSSATALEYLTSFRQRAAAVAAEFGTIVAGTGLPPVGGDIVGTVTPRDRYRAISELLRGAGAHQYSTGTHVHVAVPSRDLGVRVISSLARWAPVLVGMTANSPLWLGEDSGFASWRHIIGLSWPAPGYPPSFDTSHDYDEALDALAHGGVIVDRAMLTWACRLSERFPTVELRLADAQLRAADAVDFALIVRALVERSLVDLEDGRESGVARTAITNAGMWIAARDGISGTILNPVSGAALPAAEMIAELVAYIEPQLEYSGDLERVRAYVARLSLDGGPARQQRKAYSGSHHLPALLELYREAGTEAA
ncbi:glutamate--cysteine ligase [Rarobacter faecitabidus]|uniref:Putative glutamate--cysteine ligase 2 n=1 Tax=Rarobacter faecitabidus TaxID=13243 RepID=A0A542ZVI3_RARFA|nr:YbdK family carboxylate-amine ligase [Rarobacter faecitabidus]TQL64373.1 carboxylate-amine ligase [Rarobacter faecitabidus]